MNISYSFYGLSAIALSATLFVGNCTDSSAESTAQAPVPAPTSSSSPSSSNDPWSVAQPRDWARLADRYEQILATDPTYADPASPGARALRSRIIYYRAFSDALGDFNNRTMGTPRSDKK